MTNTNSTPQNSPQTTPTLSAPNTSRKAAVSSPSEMTKGANTTPNARPARYEVSGPSGRVAGCAAKVAAFSVAIGRAMGEKVVYVVTDARGGQAWEFDAEGEARRVRRGGMPQTTRGRG